jgi:sulfopyruvate decarboxylase subunit beta
MLSRRQVIGALADLLRTAVVVGPLGNTVRELYAMADSPAAFYLLGSMGMPVPVALGLALGQPRTVVAFEGDGGCLMSLGSLATVARYGPDTLKIVILDNGVYESTGGQPAHSPATSLAAIARGCGIPDVCEIRHESALAGFSGWLAEPGLRLAVVQTAPSAAASARVPIAPPDIFGRVREHLAGERCTACSS